MAEGDIQVPVHEPDRLRFSTPGLENPVEIEIGGAVLELPAGMTPEATKKAIENFRASPAFDSLLDKSTGAPARVRALVGSAPEQDRLANLRRFYPDAQPHGEDNFVFTNPETGKLVLYNPEGLDTGDVASAGREITQAVGATLGATAGVLQGAAEGSPFGPPGMLSGAQVQGAAGAGAGTAVAGQLFDISMSLIADRIDTRNPMQRMLDTALDFGGGAVGQRAGEMLSEGTRFALRGSRSGIDRLVRAYRNMGVEPPAGAVTGGRAVGGIEKALEVTPGSATIMQENAEKVMGQTREAVNGLVARFGQVRTEAGAGDVVRSAAVKAAERFNFRQEKLYSEAFDLVGADTPVVVNSVTALRKELAQEMARAPESLQRSLGPALAKLRAIEADAAANGGVPFEALRQIRTDIGRDLANPQLAGSTSSQNEALKRVYGALTEDMSAAAKTAGPEAAKKLETADRYTRAFMNTSKETLQKIVNFEADEKVWRYVMTQTRDGANLLARLRRNFTDEEWNTVAATALQRMGMARASSQDATGEAFSVSTFMTNWSRMTPEAKKILLGGSRYKDLQEPLDDLVAVMGSLKEMEKLTNTSNTAQNMIGFMTLQTLGGGIGLAATGDAAGAGYAIIGTVVAPRVAARLITSRAFVEWLTTPVTNANGISAQIGRLAAVVTEEPELADAVFAYLDALTMPEDTGVPADFPPTLSPTPTGATTPPQGR